MGWRAATLWACGLALAFSTPALAQDELSGQDLVDAAEAAYDQGVRHFEAGEFSEAGRSFERADELLPARVAMENAIRAWRRAGNPRRAATVATALVERDVSARGQAQFVPDVAGNSYKVIVSCDAPCTITLDGRAERYRTFYLSTDPHVFQAQFANGERETGTVGEPGEERTLVFEVPEEVADEALVPAETQTPTPRDDDGIPTPVPAWATLSVAGATAVLAGLTIWSGIDTSSAQSEFEASPSIARLEAGQSKEQRTNILLGATIGAAVLTAGLAIFTDWSFGGDEESDGDDSDDNAIRFGVGPMEGGAHASLSGRMP